MRILNRIVEWTEEGINYEADQRHAELIIEGMGLNESSNTVVTPGIKREEDDRKLDKERATTFRALVARANYLARDRTDVQFAVKELCRNMSDPKEADWTALKRLARYLVGKPRVIVKFKYQVMPEVVDAWTDTDFAGCMKTRKSTSGGMILLGSHIVKGWSSTQNLVALSSGEADCYGLVEGASNAMGVKSVLADMGVQ